MFVEDRIPGIFWLGGEEMMDAEISGDIESENREGALRLENIPEVDKHGIFARYHNSIVGHLGVERTLKALIFEGHGGAGMHRDIIRMISECCIHVRN